MSDRTQMRPTIEEINQMRLLLKSIARIQRHASPSSAGSRAPIGQRLAYRQDRERARRTRRPGSFRVFAVLVRCGGGVSREHY
jgi:hypothetical protein